MSTTETLDSLHEALEPLEMIQNEQVELSTWIHDSFSALEKLHEELTQWQSELARKETELDLRQDAIGKSKTAEKGLQKQMIQVEQELAAAREELQQLEEENSEQLREFEALEARYGELEIEHELAKARVTELETSMETERERSALDRQLWQEEFQQLRGDLEKFSQHISEQMGKVVDTVQAAHESNTPLSAGAAHAKSAELRRRAQSRREAKGRKDQSSENPE